MRSPNGAKPRSWAPKREASRLGSLSREPGGVPKRPSSHLGAPAMSTPRRHAGPVGKTCLRKAVGMAPRLSLLLILSGCTVGPDFVRPEANVNENWNEKSDARVRQTAMDQQWWKAFHDPAFDQLIQLAYRQNLPLQITGLRIMEARAQLGIALGRQYPQVQEAFGSASNVGLSRNAPNQSFPDRYFWDYQLGFDATWELDFWGRFRRDVEASRANLIASMADYDNALVSLTAEVARTYTVLRTSEVLLEITLANVKLQEEGLQIAESRFRNGATTELDVTQAHVVGEHPGFGPGAADQRAAGPERLEHAVGTTPRHHPGTPGGTQRDSDGPGRSSRGHAGGTAAPPSRYPQCRAVCRRPERPHRRGQSGSLSRVFALR